MLFYTHCCSGCNLQCCGFLLLPSMMQNHRQSEFCANLMYHESDPILGDPGAVSRAGLKGATKVFKHGRKNPWADSHRTISKRSRECWFLIGHKKCFVLLCPIGEQFLQSSFLEFVHDGYYPATVAPSSETQELSRVGKKGGTKVFKYGRKSPWVPTLIELFPKIQANAGS